MTQKDDILKMEQEIKKNTESIIRIGTHQESNYKSLQRIESKQDKFIYIFVAASIGLITTIILSR
jgi:hypothetical protein